MKNAVFDVTGMSCGGCVRHVTDALRQVAGVEIRDVSVGSAQVSFDPAETTAQTVADAIRAAGYPARERGAGTAERLACRTDPGHGSAGGGCCG